MNNRDKELDALLSSLKKVRPNDLQMARWKRIPALARRHPWLTRAMQLTAAMFLGFYLGTLHNSEHSSSENFDPTATVEVIYTKSK